MSISTISDVISTQYTPYQNDTAKTTKNDKKSEVSKSDSSNQQTSTEKSKENSSNKQTIEKDGVIYEPSQQDQTVSYNKKNYANPELVEKLKAEVERQTGQLRSLVEKLLMEQGETFAKATDMWQFLRKGEYAVDAETKAQAQKDISEGGYFSVEATSDRIIDFAKALAGDDPKMLEKMKKAFEKGYKQAEKTWGDELPDICQKTRDAVLSKFDELLKDKTESAHETESETDSSEEA